MWIVLYLGEDPGADQAEAATHSYQEEQKIPLEEGAEQKPSSLSKVTQSCLMEIEKLTEPVAPQS